MQIRQTGGNDDNFDAAIDGTSMILCLSGLSGLSGVFGLSGRFGAFCSLLSLRPLGSLKKVPFLLRLPDTEFRS